MHSPIPESLAWAYPIVQEWFVRKFGTPTEPQEQGWPHILAGRTTLISAPTGSGKTLAAFLTCIDALVRKALSGGLYDRTEILYISPLKALGNDIQKNLEAPLAEITALAGEKGLLMPEIRVAVRTGDTLMHERQKMLKRPPHILVTTPESLYILLTAEKSRNILRDVQTVIVDEIHAVADDKRGAHLTLSLERLEKLRKDRVAQPPPAVRDDLHGPQPPGSPTCADVARGGVEVPSAALKAADIAEQSAQPGAAVPHQSSCIRRIGLSATQKPIETIAHFLTGSGRPKPVIVHIGQKRTIDIGVEVPEMELGPITSHEMWDEMYDRICQLVQQHRSTLVFVNTRRLAERVAFNLAERLGEGAVAAHHGSLARKLRLEAERKLKNNEIRALVATASLELGIDIGHVDLVCHIGSPRSIAVALQRVGRAGHWRGAIPKGRFFPGTRDELIECAALVRSIHQGELDRLTIPESALCTVVAEPEGVVVGTLHEDFAVESLKGDIVLLGNTSWRIRRIENAGRVLVEDAHGAAPSIPFWLGEAPGRTRELSLQIGELRQNISDLTPNTVPGFVNQKSPEVLHAVEWLKQECGLDDSGAEQAIEYVITGRTVLGTVPTMKRIIAERFFDEGGGMQLVIHAPFGARINKAWGLALRKRFCVSFNFELQASATDNGLNIALAEQHSFPLADVFRFLHENTVKEVLQQAALLSPVFETRWRWDANRSLALLRYWGGKKIPLQVQRTRGADLLASVFPEVAQCQENADGPIKIPDHPLIREVMKDIFHEALDLDGLKQVLRQMASGEIECVAVDTPIPSVFSHEILNAQPYAYLDDAPLEERRARAVEMRRVLPDAVLNEVGAVDRAAMPEVRADAWPDVRDADELADVLHTFVAVPESFLTSTTETRSHGDWERFFEQLKESRRAGKAFIPNDPHVARPPSAVIPEDPSAQPGAAS